MRATPGPLGPYLLLATLAFTASLALGVLAGGPAPGTTPNPMRDAFGWILELPRPLGALAIFLNNLKTALLAAFPGIALGVLPAAVVTANGFIVGQTIHGVAVAGGRGFGYVALAILPHGVIEVPAILLSAAVGLRLGHRLTGVLRGRPGPSLQEEGRGALRIFLRWVLPMLAVAAVIEIYVTAALVRP
ncbi:MAG: stage II sporulation protein M [Euryarchaeota archaeon]|nr:stage II sporulation protein M [Euryarchaeota archaeon]